jgi:hypothetical protein
MQQIDVSQQLLERLSSFREEQKGQNDTLRVGNYKAVTLIENQQVLMEKIQQKISEIEMQQQQFREEVVQCLRVSSIRSPLVPDSVPSERAQISPNTMDKERAIMLKPSQPAVRHTEPNPPPAETSDDAPFGAVLGGSRPLRTPEETIPEEVENPSLPINLLVDGLSVIKESSLDTIDSSGRSSNRAFKEAVQQSMMANSSPLSITRSDTASLRSANLAALANRNRVREEVSKHIEDKFVEEKQGNPKAMNYFGMHMFPDADELKANIRRSVLHPYRVEQLYYETGLARTIATSERFDTVTMAVIGINALWMAIDIDINGSKKAMDKDVFFQLVEWLFYGYFLFEWLIRFASFRSKFAGFRDHWFLFDSLLMLLMTVDSFLPVIMSSDGSRLSILRVIRLVKVVRMARVARLLRHFPELLVLCKAIVIASRSVLSTMVMLCSLTYVFAVMFRDLTVDSDELKHKYFKTVPHSMKSLLFEVCLPDGMIMVNKLGDENMLYGVLGTVFIIASSVTLLNMLIGVLCEVIGVVSQVEKESLRVTFVKDKLRDVLHRWDLNHDMLMSESEFHKLLLDPQALKVLRDTGVDPLGLVDFTEYIFCGDFNDVSKDGISFDKFVDMILRLGGANTATVKDIVDLRKMIITKLECIEEAICNRADDQTAI